MTAPRVVSVAGLERRARLELDGHIILHVRADELLALCAALRAMYRFAVAVDTEIYPGGGLLPVSADACLREHGIELGPAAPAATTETT